MKNKFKQYSLLMRLHKPVGIFLLLWPTLWALWLAGEGHPDIFIVSIFIFGVILMRSAGCVVNDIIDRNFDGHVERTRERPLVTREISVIEASILFFILIFCAFLLVLTLNKLTILLSCVGALITLIYPLLKRITHLPQIGLGIAFSWGIPMAFAAQTNTIPNQAWLLFLASCCWSVMYDTLYAMADRMDDMKVGIKSTAILFGQWDQWLIAFLQFIFLFLLLTVAYFFPLTIFYYIGLTIAGLLFIYQQRIIAQRFAPDCVKAFANNQWVGGVIFIGIMLSYIL